MKKNIFYILLLCFLLSSSLACYARTELFTETQLVNFGKGIVVPSRFDVINDDGSYTYISQMPISLASTTNEYEDDNTILLEYDYTANRLFDEGDEAKGILPHGVVRIYDDKGNQVFYLGRDNANTLMCGLCDLEGNYAVYKFDENTIVEDGDNQFYPIESCTIYNSAQQVKKEYIADGQMYLMAKYDYSAGADCICTEYSPYKDVAKLYDEEAAELVKYSYMAKNIENVSLSQLQFKYDYDKCDVIFESVEREYSLPMVVKKNDNDKVLFVLKFRSADSYKEGYQIASEYESVIYLTEEEIALLKSDGIEYYDELIESYPEFLIDYKVEGRSKKEKSEDEKYFIESENVMVQTLTGDVALINGVLPVKLETKWEEVDGSEQITVALVDVDRNVLAKMITWDDSHTRYKYAKLVSLMNITDTDIVFEVQGTDVASEGSNKDFGSIDPKNEDAIIDVQQYMEEGFKEY